MKKNIITISIIGMLLLSGFMITPVLGGDPGGSASPIVIRDPSPTDGEKDVRLSLSKVSVYVELLDVPTFTKFSWEIGENGAGNHIVKTSANSEYTGPVLIEADVANLAPNTVISWYVKVNEQDRSETSNYYFVTLNEPPVANFTYEIADLTATFTSTSTDPDGGNISNCTWEFGDGSYGYGPNPQHVYLYEDIYDVNLTVKDDDGGATADVTKQVEVVNDPPVARFIYAIVAGTKTVHFDASNSSDLTGTITGYFWNFGDGKNSTEKKLDYAYEQDYKTYTVTLTVTDSGGKSNTTSKDVTIADLTKPTVKIVKPIKKGIYAKNEFKRSRFFGMPFITGDITIEVNATDSGSGIARVDFYINKILKGNDTSAPYSYNWSKDRMRLFHVFTIKVVAYDNAGNSATTKVLVRKFL